MTSLERIDGRLGLGLLALLLGCGSASAQFPEYPPPDVTARMDRDQMLARLGITLPDLPPKAQDPYAPPGARPVDLSDPEGNWTDDLGWVVVRSPFGLWTNYADTEEGLWPGKESWRVGTYEPIDLLRMADGSRVLTEEAWWDRRRPELLGLVQHAVWGVVPDDSVLPTVRFSVTESKGGAVELAFIEKRIIGEIELSRYPVIRHVPRIEARLRIPEGGRKSVPVMVVIGGGFWMPIERYWALFAPQGWWACFFDALALQPDDGAGLMGYLIGLCNRGRWRELRFGGPWRPGGGGSDG